MFKHIDDDDNHEEDIIDDEDYDKAIIKIKESSIFHKIINKLVKVQD